MPVHFRLAVWWFQTACDRLDRRGLLWTEDPERVTCPRCKRALRGGTVVLQVA